MRLTAFGTLKLQNVKFGRKKPLLLLCYLALEGSQDRRYIAEIFWPKASDNLNSLSRALSQLRKISPIEADNNRVWVNLETDVEDFLQAVKTNEYKKVIEIYQAPFADGISFNDWGIELEDWVYEKRELLAAKAQRVMLEQAEIEASRGRFVAAAELAEKAYKLKGAPIVEPEDFSNYYSLLVAGNNELALKLKQEALEYGIELSIDTDHAKTRLQTNIIGREQERDKLASLQAGQWAWVQASSGMGKTTLLKSLSGTYLAAKSGLPYATLEPLVGSSISDGKEAMLRKLAYTQGTWLIDGWLRMDDESRELISELQKLGTQATIVIAAEQKPPFNVDLKLELSPISKEDLSSIDDAWEKTEGLPILVGALLRGENLDNALENRIDNLSKNARDIYIALSLTDTTAVVARRALKLKAQDTAKAFEELSQAGLVLSSGKVRAQRAAKSYLESQKIQAAEIALLMARQLKGTQAFPLYQQSRLFWEDSDLPQIRKAYLAWANELMRRGFPQRTLQILEDLKDSDEVCFVRARAQERAGLYKEALDELMKLKDNSSVLAQKGLIYWRLGKADLAKVCALKALDGDELEPKAEAHMTLAQLAYSAGRLKEMLKQAKRSVALWRTIDNPSRLANALTFLAVAESINDADPGQSFTEALRVAKNNPLLEARILLNQGMVYKNANKLNQSLKIFQRAIELLKNVDESSSARAWNNIGVIHHLQNNKKLAEQAYTEALKHARVTGEKRMLGMFLANLAELTENQDAWEEALTILKDAGQNEVIEQHISQLPQNHPFRQLNN